MTSPTIIEAAVAHRFARTDEIETWNGQHNRVTQQIPLDLGQTVISREVLAPDVYGAISISSTKSDGPFVTIGERYVLRNGTLIQMPDSNRGKERKASIIRHGIIAARILFGRVDHSEYDALGREVHHEDEYED